MATNPAALAESLQGHLGERLTNCEIAYGEVTIQVLAAHLLEVCELLRDEALLGFEELVDLAGIDYLEYGVAEWTTNEATREGFSRAVEASTFGRFCFDDPLQATARQQPRFAVVYHLLSVRNNQRVRVKVFCEDDDFPVIDSITGIWASADWYEREAFDLYGIIFDGHPDLRRILTDYGFVGHPFRKDFPLVGNVEMRYDPEQARVVYQPVSIEPRVLVPKVIRQRHRYHDEAAGDEAPDA